MAPRTLLITGATGQQGGALVDALLAAKADVEILGVTRDPASGSAIKLAAKSPKIKLIQGNLDDVPAIFARAKQVADAPVWGVFSVQGGVGVKSGAEERQGKDMIDTALAAGVMHFVYSSVDRGGDKSLDDPTDIPHFISKYNIEKHLIAATENKPMTWTILRPVAYMDNLVPGFMGQVFATAWREAVKDRPLQLVAVRDIGVFAAKALLEPATYKGRGIALAGDSLTYAQAAAIFKQKTGTAMPTTFAFVASGIMWMEKDFGLMFRWFYEHGYGADIEGLKTEHAGLKDFATWLETESKFKTK